jgi:hypothetical protein
MRRLTGWFLKAVLPRRMKRLFVRAAYVKLRCAEHEEHEKSW